MDYLNLTVNQILKNRFKTSQTDLRNAGVNLNGFREHVLTIEPLYDNSKGWDKIKSVWYGYSADVRLTELATEMRNELTVPCHE